MADFSQSTASLDFDRIQPHFEPLAIPLAAAGAPQGTTPQGTMSRSSWQGMSASQNQVDGALHPRASEPATWPAPASTRIAKDF